MTYDQDTVVVVFLKEPRPGHVKTRLAASIGPEAAMVMYRLLAETVVRALDDVPFTVVCAVDRPAALEAVSAWLGESHRLIVQEEGDLGTRLLGATKSMRLAGYRNVIIIGTDAPQVDASCVIAAAAALQDHDVVLGPAYDGGYYLVGTSSDVDGIFDNITWSTEHVLRQTLGACAEKGASVQLLAPLRDIDTLDDVRQILPLLEKGQPLLARRMEHILETRILE
jgi:uncharacterized protein